MTNPIIDELGTKKWYNAKDQPHREDGPALIYTNGREDWCIDGKWHREDGPAIDDPKGESHWYINGKRIE
jgi:hypothetical protein